MFIEQVNTPRWKKGICKRVKGWWEGAGGPSCSLQWRLGGEKHRLQTACIETGGSRKHSMSLQEGGRLLTVHVGTHICLFMSSSCVSGAGMKKNN